MRHGLTMGELARWFVTSLALDVDCQVVTMSGWEPAAGRGYGWPLDERIWINPSPNAPNLSMARCYPGTVMLEGTTVSEGRGTTRPLEIIGAPDLEPGKVAAAMAGIAPQWMRGCYLRECWFEPTFHKYSATLCAGLQIHAEGSSYDHDAFRPWRLVALALKALRKVQPEYRIWREFAYEYEHDRLAFDLINGSKLLRLWIDDPAADAADLDALAMPDEAEWRAEREAFLLYPA
jgi:uncharacterized protein YbbC (DUF1343 family)